MLDERDPAKTVTRVMISGRALLDLLSRHPEIELELVNNATAQVAERFKSRVNIDRIIEQARLEITQNLNYRHHMPAPVLQAIRDTAKEQLDGSMVQQADAAARRAIDERMSSWLERAEKQMEARIERLASDKVAALLRAAAGIGSK